MDTLQISVASVVKQYRSKLHMSQQDLADALDITRTSISNIEHGKQAMTLAMFCKVAGAFHIEPTSLLHKVLTVSSEPDVSKEDVADARIRKLITYTIKSK